MTDNTNNQQQPQWMPTAGGVLSIVAGALALIGALVLFFIALGYTFNYSEVSPIALVGFLAFWLVIAGAIAIIGGISAVRRRNWGLALTGAIASLLTGNAMLGALAIIFIAMSRKEYTA